nr:hypothetical protein [uncultured Sulfurimonas sp.]
MYKNLLFILILAIFAGCSAPKPQQMPSWYTNPPKDYKNFYGVASSNSETKAKNIAINIIRENIAKDLDAMLDRKNHNLKLSYKMLDKIKNENLHLSKTLSMRAIKIEKVEVFNAKTLILVSVSKEKLFEKIHQDLKNKIRNLKTQYSKNKEVHELKRYLHLKPLMAQYAYLNSRILFASVSISTYNPNDNFLLLQNIKDEYNALKKNINFFVLSDVNSIIYTDSIKKAILNDELSISRKSKDKHTLKLLITSQGENSNEYTFDVSKNLVKFTILDANKNKIFFRQHTFIGKSRKNHEDAKLQTIDYVEKKIQHLGIYNFLGIYSK